MKLHLTSTAGMYAITGYGEGFVLVNGQRHERNLLVLPDRLEPDWLLGSFEDLTSGHFEALTLHGPDLVLLGTGGRQRFPQPGLYAGLMARGIGVEIMDMGAACRTYNFLSAEGRRVAAALIV
ncbi:MAG: Xcc1710-like domain-containing protein [Hydrogenophilaceae bacterium]|nr:Xcc1710-like domain-containing protein [Hydrogenophilaceae bacterium]